MEICNGMLLGQSSVFELSLPKVGWVKYNPLVQADDEQVLVLLPDKPLRQKLCLHQQLHCNGVKSAVCFTFRECFSTNTCGTKRD